MQTIIENKAECENKETSLRLRVDSNLPEITIFILLSCLHFHLIDLNWVSISPIPIALHL